MSIIVAFFVALTKFMAGGLLVQIIFSLVLNVIIFGACFIFYKNFASTSLDYAIGFFNFFGFDDLVQVMQTYWLQLPPVFTDTVAYFQLGSILALIVNNYIAGIFLAWILRKFA
jgi:hypothetical protein